MTFRRKRLFNWRMRVLHVALRSKSSPVMCIITREDLLRRVTRTFVSHIMENDLRC